MSVEMRGFWREQAHQDADLSQGSKRAALAASSACVASCVPNYKFRAPAARRTSCRRRRAKNGCDGLWGRPDETCARCSAPAALRRRRILGRVVPRGESSACRVRAPAAVRILKRPVSRCESCCDGFRRANPGAPRFCLRIPQRLCKVHESQNLQNESSSAFASRMIRRQLERLHRLVVGVCPLRGL